MRTQNTFAINAKTCTLNNNEQEGGGIILDGTKYVVPIYQRPYSWRENEISRFISDIFISYWGPEHEMEREPMFIGTMQLTAKNGSDIQEIIDGQQRLTTLLVLIKVLKVMFTENVMLSNLSLNWISTKVDSGKQKEYLEAFIDAKTLSSEHPLNPYFKNATLVKSYLDKHIIDDDGVVVSEFEIDDFLDYLLGSIYFVVIETNAGLSKILQIFDAINTSGLDLDGGDLFKIRMYEYLTKKNPDDKAFENISTLYKTIDEHNNRFGRVVTDIRGILSIYQYVLIARHKLPGVLYNYSVDRFYDELFDTLLGVQLHENFNVKQEAPNVKLSLEEIERIIDVQYYWEDRWVSKKEFTLEDVSAFNLIFRSRYRRYWRLPLVVQFMYGNKDKDWKNMLYFMRQLNKLFFIYSVRYQKAISEINYRFMHELINSIVNNSFEDTMQLLNDKIGYEKFHNPGFYDLNSHLVKYSKSKRLICLFSAMLDETYKTTDAEKVRKISKALFESNIDIEHIQSLNDQDEKKRKAVSEEWGEEINSLGNLMILERDINRSIGNSDYYRKVKSYNVSKFQIVKNQAAKYSDEWTLEKSKERAKSELEKILQYLFEQPINI